MILSPGTLVAVVDGETLNLFRNSGAHTPELTALPSASVPDRTSGTAGHRSSAANPDNDTQAEDGFAAGVAALLNQMALSGEFDDLVVIAPPRALGELRKHWHKALEAKLVGEIAKDLRHQTPDEIAAVIAKA